MRDLVLTLIFVGAFFMFSMQSTTAAPVQQALISMNQIPPAPSGAPGSIFVLQMVINNNFSDNYNFTISTTSLPSGTAVSNPGTIAVNANQSVQFEIQLSTPATITAGTYNVLIQASGTRTTNTGNSPSTTSASSFAQFTVTGPTPTLSPTATRSPTATPTTGPTCPELNRDPGNDFGNAKLIVVDSPNNHGICEVGDEDWFKFAAIGGKVYTPDITRFDIGLDLSIELYDSDGNRLAFNDDYYARTPQPTAAGNGQTPLPTRDIGPRIQSWRAPQDGIYYIRVRDTANVGGGNRTYTFIIYSESYGPTPSTIAEICRDLFEEDGLPEEAKLITSNEIQRGHLLCPSGDADWVKFFGKTGKTYYIYTDTRPYRNNPSANPSNAETQAGADTVLFLFDRDGNSIITFNDDIEDSTGSSLDSQIRFVPQVDGFYFAQVKNTGDIGNQFIKYDVALTLCAPGRDNCGRSQVASTPPQATVPPTSIPTQSPVALLTQTATQTLTPTPTPTATTSTGGAGDDPQFLGQTVPSELVNGPINGFADPAFETVWYRSDQVVASKLVDRSWLWGPRGRMARAESYVQIEGGLRQVQYFDKARMEVSDPAGNRSSRWFVTTGLLVAEMVTGRVQIGNNEFVDHLPARIPVAGDENDSFSPSYASFRPVVTTKAEDRSGQKVLEVINSDGIVTQLNQEVAPGTQLAYYAAETGHNIPQVFWNYMHMQGLVQEGNRTRSDTIIDWVFTLGYPISEPYWMTIRVGGVQRNVLVQLFQRRVLTYNPANPPNWQVEMGNVGRHYYQWRYGVELPGEP